MNNVDAYVNLELFKINRRVPAVDNTRSDGSLHIRALEAVRAVSIAGYSKRPGALRELRYIKVSEPGGKVFGLGVLADPEKTPVSNQMVRRAHAEEFPDYLAGLPLSSQGNMTGKPERLGLEALRVPARPL